MPDRPRTDAPPPVPTPWRPSVFAAEFWGVLVLGAAVVALAVAGLVGADGASRPVALLALVALVVFGELRPVVTTRSYGEGTTPSIAFTFAILFVWGPWPAILAQAVASVVADASARKAWWRTAVNPAQYAISFLLAWGAMAATGYRAAPDALHSIQASDVWAMVLAWLVYFMANNAIVSSLLAAYAGERYSDVF